MHVLDHNVYNILRCLPVFQNQMFHCLAFPVQLWSYESEECRKDRL